ncbi:precorrin-6A/cobalt-precorrin-6A reductase [Streptomyces sviceus]|uniref:precorrin-6A/cobalt-precorrin-6A reductase n=1 Tax=Streptomyces sviceus TaxID=285530 RepID=UPI0036E47567
MYAAAVARAPTLAAWLRVREVNAVIDATHPFAATLSLNAARAAAAQVPCSPCGTPAGSRRGWRVAQGRFAGAGRRPAARARQAGVPHHGAHGARGLCGPRGPWFLVRSVEAPKSPAPPRMEVLLDRGAFALDAEREVLRRPGIGVVVAARCGATWRFRPGFVMRLGLAEEGKGNGSIRSCGGLRWSALALYRTAAHPGRQLDRRRSRR